MCMYVRVSVVRLDTTVTECDQVYGNVACRMKCVMFNLCVISG
jgi:hypothetical protein